MNRASRKVAKRMALSETGAAATRILNNRILLSAGTRSKLAKGLMAPHIAHG
jgi:hypothetical protein